MDKQADRPVSPGAAPAGPAVLPDVATSPHPTPQSLPGDAPDAGQGVLQEVLPQITELAQKVGGFKRLSEIAAQLDRAGTGR